MTKVTDRLASFSDKLRRRLEVVAASVLDEADVEFVRDILVMRTALLYDLLDGSTQAEMVTANWERTVLGLTTLDVELYTSDWKTLREILTSDDFLAQIGEEEVANKAAFKQQSCGRIHYPWILNATLALMEEKDWYRKVNQWVVFDSRANLASLDLTSSCCDEYLQFEHDMDAPGYWTGRAPAVYPGFWVTGDQPVELGGEIVEEYNEIHRVVRRCARDMFGDFCITDYPFRPKHGNGATLEVERRDADPWHKNRYFRVDGDIINYMRYRVPEEQWQEQFYLPYRGLDRTSQLVCVPKSMTKNRTISKEPTTLQFLQQDIFQALDDYFTERPRLGIDLHDQDRSRALALEGSADGTYATIDLSSASDSVSVALVEYLFDGLPVLYPLMATRSTHVHVRSRNGEWDEVIETKKFAPMGSAVCFPVECMVFSILCEAAVRLMGHTKRKNTYVVYGDDIVIRSEYAAKVVELLEFFHFTVNRDKSFGVRSSLDEDAGCSRFREACGIEALNGRDITPLRLSRRLVSVTKNDSDHQAGLGVGLVDLVNRAFLYDLRHLRRWLSDQLVRHKWYRTILRLSVSDYRQFTADIICGHKSWITCAVPFVITDDMTDTQWRAFGARSGLCDRFHRCSVLVTVAKARGPRVKYHDSNDYYTWCLSARHDTVACDDFIIDDTGLVTIRPRDLKWSKAWVSLQRPAHLSPDCPTGRMRG